MAPRIPRLICGVLITSQMLTGCTSWQVVGVTPRALVDSAHARPIQIHEKGGAKYILDDPAVVGDSLRGTVPRVFPADRMARLPRSVGNVPRVIPLATIDRVAVRKPSGWKTTLLVLGVPAAVVGMLALACCGPMNMDFSAWR